MAKKKFKSTIVTVTEKSAVELAESLFHDLCKLIEQARVHVAEQINTELVSLYWKIGKRIKNGILKEKRAEYGKQVLETLSKQLVLDYGKGFSRSNLADMVRFAEAFPSEKIFQTLSGKLGWSHFRMLIYIDDPLRREFYTEMCRVERSDKGQMELYLRWLDKYERQEGEEAPVGLIFCASKSAEQIELLSLDSGDIRVAEYVTELLPKSILRAKLHDAIRRARGRLSRRINPKQIAQN